MIYKKALDARIPYFQKRESNEIFDGKPLLIVAKIKTLVAKLVAQK